MDLRLLTACRLLMEVAAEQLTAEPEPLSVDDGQRTVNDEPRHADYGRRTAEEPLMVYGDNPNFDPARFAALRRGQEDFRPPEAEAAPLPDQLSFEAFRPPFAAPPVHVPRAANGGTSMGEAVVRRADPPARPDGPTGTLTMQDISDHFERDARRY